MTVAKLENGAPAIPTDRRLIADRYRTHTRIGHGRLGEIFAATDESYQEFGVEQQLAIQVIPESIVRNNKLFNKLNLGFSVLRGVAHPNIVNFRHFGRDGKFSFLVMELLDGMSLRAVLDDAKTLSSDEVKPVIRGVGEALRLLHAKDMVHGNLTTKNVFITEKLEVRLLDVLPLGSSEAINRRPAINEPFSRCTVEDDVFGLACLAYEMLAGKHPFNYSPLAEAKLAGLGAERIASTTDREWNALRLALSFDRELRTSSIADFMRDFGIDGTERLRPTVDQPARHEPRDYWAAREAPPMTRPAVSGRGTEIAAPVVAVDSVAWNEKGSRNARALRRRTSPLRAVSLGILLTGLSAWFFYGQPQDDIEHWIGYIDQRMNVETTDQRDDIIAISIPAPDPSAATEQVAQLEQPAATVGAAPADVEAERSEPQLAEYIERIIAALAQPDDQAAPAAQSKEKHTTDSNDESMNITAHQAPAEADVDPMQPEAELALIESIVSVSERDGAALIAPPRTENLATPLIWWTSEHTANADNDFIPVEQQTIADTTIEGGNMLHIPLVNDNLPEPPESFFVNLGFQNTQQGHIERIATVRVDIIDDDLR